jgi:hypothetical protein
MMNEQYMLEKWVTQKLCKIVDSPVALGVYLRLRYDEGVELAKVSINPSDYLDAESFADDYLLVEIMRKSPNLPTGIDTDKVTMENFRTAEWICRMTNLRFNAMSCGSQHAPYHELHFEIRERVNEVLGNTPIVGGTVLERVQESFRHGGGGTFGVSGSGFTAADKYRFPVTMTPNLRPYARAIMGESWYEFQPTFEIVPGDKFSVVPKDALKGRAICPQPTLNLYYQLGVGSVLRDCIKASGLNLNSQERNRKLAARAWKDGLATIDLSMASDTIAKNVVREFFPSDWLKLLELGRCERTLINGVWVELEKWSAMGNGYTFELETLLFMCVVESVVPKRQLKSCSVYGDDIIVPQMYANQVIEILKYMGFRVNERKSFLAGAFFESCGRDYFHGVPVRPFYLKGACGQGDDELPPGIPYAVSIANKLRLYAFMRGRGYMARPVLGYGTNINRTDEPAEVFGCDSRFRKLWVSIVNRAPRMWRNTVVPASLGDTGVIGSFSEGTPYLTKKPIGDFTDKVEPQYDGMLVRTLSRPSEKTLPNHGGVILCKTAIRYPSRTDGVCTENYFDMGFQTMKDKFCATKRKNVYIFQWTHGFWWV